MDSAPAGGQPLYRHRAPYRELIRRYRAHTGTVAYWRAFALSAVFFTASIAASGLAIQYATERASNPVTDIFLSNVPVVNVSNTFAIATILLIVFAFIVTFAHPKRAPFVMNSLGLFYFIRAVFVSLTHLGPFPERAVNTDWGTILSHMLFSPDLFFSGHVGTPFLLALIFWREKSLRLIFLAWSVFMGLIVLLGHLHYSIDVASAFFITYTIYVLAQKFFPQTLAIFRADEPIQV